VAEAEDGESMLGRHGGVEEDFQDARVLVEVGDGEGGESVPIEADGRAQDRKNPAV